MRKQLSWVLQRHDQHPGRKPHHRETARGGTAKAVVLMEKPEWDENLLEELSEVMVDASICGLGQAAPNPMRSVMKYFPEELK